MPREHFDSHEFLAKKEILSYEELTTVVESLVPLGLTKVRLTGGEPLLRRDVCSFIEMLPKELDLAMTTNGILLERFAKDLAAAGLNRVTVSLDALDVETFQAMGDTNETPETVLRGIEAARMAGLTVKVNTVIRAGYNEHSVERVAERFVGTDVVVRYIEFMDVGTTNGWAMEDVVTAAEIRQQFDHLTPLPANKIGEVAKRYQLPNGGEVGLITSVTEPFCGDCSRARLSADGHLYTCLFASKGLDLLTPMRMGASDAELLSLIEECWESREDRYSEIRSEETSVHPRIEMSFIGG